MNTRDLLQEMGDLLGRLSAQIEQESAALLAENADLRAANAELRRQLDAALEELGRLHPPHSQPLREVELLVREVGGVARAGEVATGGIPLPRGLVRSAADLSVAGPSGAPLAAEVVPLGQWSDGSLQWVLVSFRADAGAGEAAAYRLQVWEPGKAPKPAGPEGLKVEKAGEGLRVTTGAAVFEIDARSLLAGAANAAGKRLVLGTAGTVVRGDGAAIPTTGPAGTVRRFEVERQGPLTAVVVAEIDTGAKAGSNPAGAFVESRRYTFTAGSPAVRVRKTLTWEGSHLGRTWKNGSKLNAEIFAGMADTLTLALGEPQGALASAEKGSWTTIDPGRDARLEQRLRAKRTDPRSWGLAAGGATIGTGARATGGVLAARGRDGAVAVALRRMDRFEPQALALDAAGRELAVHWASDRFWLSYRQAGFAEGTVAALPAEATPEMLDRLLWAPLNYPLLPMAPPEWYRECGVPDAILPAGAAGDPVLARYDAAVAGTLERTAKSTDREGIDGLMTTGLFPRYWGKPYPSTELSGENDPTPADDWDDAFLTATWADYHNTSTAAYLYALRKQDPFWIHELGTFASLRMLYTMMMNGAPGDSFPYVGQVPAGYGGYRADFNSSHAYIEGLYLHHWLTGDAEVPRRLRRGATTQRKGVEAGKAGIIGRIGNQWMGAYRFLGTVVEEGREEFAAFLDRCLEQVAAEHLVRFTRDGRDFAAIVQEKVGPGAGSYGTSNLWIQGFYDFETMARWEKLDPALLVALARTYVYLAPATAGGDGSIAGKWPRSLKVTVGGDGAVELANAGDENDGMRVPELYSTDKPAMAAFLARAAVLAPDEPLLRQRAEELAATALTQAEKEAVPLGKLSGLILSRLHAAVAVLEG